jgi:hypothetical protein
MTSGGARNRSGPQPDPNSAQSDRRALNFAALPAEGYRGEVPEFPLGRSTTDDLIATRELAVWDEAWRSPQAAAWAKESWRWPILGEYCRLKALIELSPAATAALVGQIHRYRDQLGLTPAGLRENGWRIVADEVTEKREERRSSRDRLKASG